MRSTAEEPLTGPYGWEDFIHLDEDDLRELIDGHLVEVEVPTYLHEHVVTTLIILLGMWARAHGGHVLSSGYKLKVSPKRGVMPDVQFYRAGNTASLRQQLGLEHGRPDLVVEVVSPSSRRYDRVVKLGWYTRLRIPEYWIVDPEAQTLERLVLTEGAYVLAEGRMDGETFRPRTLRGLAIPLAELWDVAGVSAPRRRRTRAHAGAGRRARRPRRTRTPSR
jgi:Uma2 family endonuclease